MTPAKPHNPLIIGLHAARANLLPGLIVQTLMIALVVGYYLYPPLKEPLNRLATFKNDTGLLFSIVAAAFAAAFAPELLKILCFQKGIPTRDNLRTLGFSLLYWGFQGTTVDLLYRFQGWLWGNELRFSTIAAKVCTDQFLFTPVYAVVANTLFYDLLHCGFTWPNLRARLNFSYYKSEILPVLLTTWAIWIPLVSAVYALPPLLQFPLFTLAVCWYATILAWIGAARAPKPAPIPESLTI